MILTTHLILKGKYIFFILIIVLALHSQSLSGQDKADSLQEIAATTNNDSLRIGAWIGLVQLKIDDAVARKYLDSAMTMAKASGNDQWYAVALLSEAKVLEKEKNYTTALASLESAIALLKNYPMSKSLATAYGLAGSFAWTERNSAQSIEYRKKWADAYRQLNESTWYGKALNNLGVTYKNTGLNVQALEVLLIALRIAEEEADSTQIGAVLNNMANTYKNQNQYEVALEMHERALEIRKRLSNPDNLADTHNNMGLVFRKMNRHEEALHHFNKSLAIRVETQQKRGLSYAYNNLGLVFLDMDQTDSALVYFEKSMKIKKSHGDIRDLSIGHINIGEAYLKMNNLDSAESRYLKALVLCNKKGYAELEIEGYLGLSVVHEAKGNYTQAFNYLKLHDQLEDSMHLQNNERSIQELQASYELQKTQNELAHLEQRQQLQALQLENYELTRNSLYIGISAILIVVLVVLLRYRSVNRLNRALKSSNKNLRETQVSKEEKETLLKEVHHRVKNNLQIITSLIRLQSETISDPQVSSLFNESQDRIKSMALVHEELYRSDDFTSIQVEKYFRNLITELLATYSLSTQVNFSINTNVNQLGVNTLIPLGLMVNEMITNALKHAFNGGDGELSLELFEESDGAFSLKLSDNGRGFPQDVMLNNPSTLGLELIHTLAGQLDGEVSFNNNPGAEYTVTFRCQD